MATSILADFRYVELESDTALIDSRVYCREVIEVDHSDWMRNVLCKHQPQIENWFGHLRFENGDGVKRPQGGGKQEIYVLLTEPQCNALLALSRNIGKVAEKKLQLIADFQIAKEFVRQQLQRQFESPATPQYPASDRNFCNSIYKVQAMSGIKSITQIRKAIERDFVEGVDYAWLSRTLSVNTETYLKLSTKFRSAEGVNLTMLPDKLDFEACQYFKLKSNGKKNSRVAKSSAGIQLELDLNC